MLRKFVLCLILIQLSGTVFAQDWDSTFYTSEFEADIFQKWNDSIEIDPIDLLLAIDYTKEGRENFIIKSDELKRSLKEKGLAEKATKKQIKEIYKSVHSSLLEKYVEDVCFSEIVKNGEYNCVTASALYAVLLDEFSIDYQIKETPTHVYIVADPNGSQTLIESTLPKNGIIVFDDAFKKEFVQYMLKGKLISQTEYETNSLDELFDEYYNSDKDINIVELAAIQYYNKGFFAIQEEKYVLAERNLAKAYTIYPSPTIMFVYNAVIAELLNQQNIHKEFKGETLANYLNLNAQSSESLINGLEYFELVGDEWVVNHPQIDKFNEYYNDFLSAVSDTMNINEFKTSYHYTLAFYDYANGLYGDALKKAERAYLANPDNLRIRILVNDIAAKYMITDRNHSSMLDVMEYYFTVFPFLLENEGFQEYYTYSFMKVISMEFRRDEYDKGTEYIDRFNEVMRENPTIYLNKDYVEECFATVSYSYLRKGEFTKVRQYLEMGLVYAPESTRLKELQSNINDLNFNYKPTASIVVGDIPVSTEEFKETFLDEFPNCWVSESDENYTIKAKESRKVEYKNGERTEVGRWAYRPKSKLLYLVPSRDEDDYLMFKVVSVEKGKVKLRLYVDNKLSKEEISLTSCQ